MKSDRWRNLALLALAELLAMSLWFSASAVVPQLTAEWRLSGAEQSWMTMSVQIGFVAGSLFSALLNLPDRIPLHRLIGISALCGGILNGAIPLLGSGPTEILLLRFLTGVALAGVYPPGMKLVATWFRENRGLGIGILVGALTIGSALPHLLNGLALFGMGGMPPWRDVLISTSALALASSLVTGLFVRTGPFLTQPAPFNWKYAKEALAHRPTRLANFGYFGHMWELYAMWTWVPIFLIASYGDSGLDQQHARLAGFAVIAIGGVGCVIAGRLADTFGRTTLTMYSLAISGFCALVAGFCYSSPVLLTGICLIWGFAVVADSAQFSAAVSELADPRYVGTALTLQTSLGFLLTLITIRIVPPLVEMVGWGLVFAVLVPGPVFGIWSMWRLRTLPEASRLAMGNR